MNFSIKYIIIGLIVGIVVFFLLRNFKGIVKFLKEVKAELSKVSWSTRSEIIGSTVVVIVTTAFLAIFIGLWDFLLARFISLVIR
jgi:preprotein translocase subunit SecE